jgi:hypothetical protein
VLQFLNILSPLSVLSQSAKPEVLAGALNSHLELQRYKVLFISGNYSCILGRLDRKFTELKCAVPLPSSSS